MWTYTCLDPSTGIVHKLTHRIVGWRFSGGRFVKVNEEEFAVQKEKARVALLADARSRGLSVSVDEEEPADSDA